MIMVEYLLQIEYASYMKQHIKQQIGGKNVDNWGEFMSQILNLAKGMDNL